VEELVEAVRRGDAERVLHLLEDGADPDTLDPAEGVPVLCTAVAAYDQDVASALVQGGADPLRPLPDGTTALLRAVDGGSELMTHTLLPEPVRVDALLRQELLARARHWVETGVAEELRRRTGLEGPPERTAVRNTDFDVEYDEYQQFTLGGLTARDGHAAVLTLLEERFGVRTPFDELMARALTHPDRDHAVWRQAVFTLGRREDEEDWAAARKLSGHPDRLHRLFAADALHSLAMGDLMTEDEPFAGRAREVLPWAERERDPEVLAYVLQVLNYDSGPDIEAVGLLYLRHPHPLVRLQVLDTIEQTEDRLLARPENLTVVLALTRDPEACVREAACNWLVHYRGREPEVCDALFALTRDEQERTRAHAVAGLAYKDDPRCEEAEERLVPVSEWIRREDVGSAMFWYRRRREEAAETTEAG
jgi:HEAT repeat protein